MLVDQLIEVHDMRETLLRFPEPEIALTTFEAQDKPTVQSDEGLRCAISSHVVPVCLSACFACLI